MTGSGGATATGGSGGATATVTVDPESAALCNAWCFRPCVEDVCSLDDLIIGAGEVHNTDPNGGATSHSLAYACWMDAWSVRVIAVQTSGPCRLRKLETLDDPGYVPFDVGAITVTTATAGTLDLAPDPNSACVKADLGATALFSPGDTVNADVAGTGAVLPFSLQTNAPDALDFSTDPVLQRGQPFKITVTPPVPLDYVSVQVGIKTLICEPNAQGDVTVPGDLTALFDQGPTSAMVVAVQSSAAETTFGPAGAKALLRSAMEVAKQIPYSP